MAQTHVVNNHFVGQANQGDMQQPNSSTTSSRIWDFMRINPTSFHGTKVDEDPQVFIDEVFKVVEAMGVTHTERVELASYKHKEVAQVWFEQWSVKRYLEREVFGRNSKRLS